MPNYWTLGARPDLYRLLDAVRDSQATMWLTAGSHLAPGDRVAIYKFKGQETERGVVAFGEVLTSPELLADTEDPYWEPGAEAQREAALRVRVRYVAAPNLPLWVDTARTSVVNELAITRVRGGTVYRVTPDQWQRLVAEAGGWPAIDSDGVADARIAIEAIAGKPSGQRFRASEAERTAIEMRAVAVATEHFEQEGWAVEDVSRNESFDLRCTRGDDVRRVEVKGTTSSGEVVPITVGEVDTARAHPTAACFAIVTAIKLTRASSTAEPVASEGVLRVIFPWAVDQDALAPLGWAYTVPNLGEVP
jgi:predicted RNA-binding protein with PUA-like domain